MLITFTSICFAWLNALEFVVSRVRLRARFFYHSRDFPPTRSGKLLERWFKLSCSVDEKILNSLQKKIQVHDRTARFRP